MIINKDIRKFKLLGLLRVSIDNAVHSSLRLFNTGHHGARHIKKTRNSTKLIKSSKKSLYFTCQHLEVTIVTARLSDVKSEGLTTLHYTWTDKYITLFGACQPRIVIFLCFTY